MVKGSLSDYKLVVIPEVYMFDEDFLCELKDYAKNGGNVIISGINSTKTFSDILGVHGEEICKYPYFVPVGNETTIFEANYLKVKPNSAKVLKYYMNNHSFGVNETEYPVVTLNEYGKGKVIGVYGDMFTSNAITHYPRNRRFFKELVDECDINWLVDQIEAPYYVHFNIREKDNKLIINLVNTGKVVTAAELPITDMVEEVPCVPQVKFRVKLDKEPTYVEQVPSQVNLCTDYKDGYLYVTVKNLDIMESIVISQVISRGLKGKEILPP